MKPGTGAGVPVRWRLPVLAAGAGSLLAGLYAGLVLVDGSPGAATAPGARLADVHGPLMVFGVVGTLVALERAVALGARWGLAAPACSGLGGLVLAATGPTLAGQLLSATGSVLLLGVYRMLWHRQPGPALLAQLAGAFAWYAAMLLWIAGFSVAETVPWMATFVVATIAGERLELAHVALTNARAERWFLAALLTLVLGAAAATLWTDGAHLFGAGLLAVVAWLALFDVARRTVRATGLPRYVAVGLLAGYGWLALAGLLWAGAGATSAGSRYDATGHAVFLGFTMSMIFAHAPVILPAVLRRPLPYHRVLYLPLALLHGSLLARVAVGDGLSVGPVWRWAGVGNVVAVLGFVVCAAASATAHRRRSRRPPATAPTRTAGASTSKPAAGGHPASAEAVRS